MFPTFASVGKTTRMNRIFREDGRAAMVAINQGIAMGPRAGIEDVQKILETLLPEHPDSFTIHRGIALRMCDTYAGKAALILKATNKTRFFGPDETPLSTVEDALMLGADAISVGLSLCDEKEQYTIHYISEIVAGAEKFGMPTVAHAYPNGALIDDSVRYSVEQVGYAVRVAKELGIDIIKTFWTGSGETFAKIVEFGSPCKVVISGGPRCKTLRACFEMTWQGVQAGCHGITYGRNIWQHEYPAAVMRGLVAILHKNATVNEAMEAASDAAKRHLE
jgi:class I fructose-bisphosphate aldolase/fructose-bisphosphate aldolase/2-amino-3,7-dideoxy-D-threo-hept-6-ulosonate synthase